MPILLDYNTYLENEIAHINQTFREHVHKDQVKKRAFIFLWHFGFQLLCVLPEQGITRNYYLVQ